MPRPAAARPLLGYGGMLSPGARRYHVILPCHRHPTANPARGGTQIDLIIDQIGAYAPSNRKIRAARPRVGQHVHPRPPDDPPTWTTRTVTYWPPRPLPAVTTVTDRYWPKGYGGMPWPAAARSLLGYGGMLWGHARCTIIPLPPGDRNPGRSCGGFVFAGLGFFAG